jgi:hypothetical protein
MGDEIVKFFGLIEKEVVNMEYGTMTVTVFTSKGMPITKTTNVVIQKRRRYKVEHSIDKSDSE